jgi:ligand-binding sensor domain-containing protein
MKAHYYRILFLAIFIAFSYSKAFGSDYFFYKCNPKMQEFKLKVLYFYTLNEQMHKTNTIQALQKSGYENFGNSSSLLIRNKNGWFVSTKLINRTCKINQNIYKITIGSAAGNPNPMGNCGAFSSYWVTIAKNNKAILPKTIFQDCTSQSAISEIALNSNGKLQIFHTNPYAQDGNHNTNQSVNERTIYVGQSLNAITSDKFGNIWVASYQGQYIAKINQDGKVDYFGINGHPTSIVSDNAGNIFVLAGNYIVKFFKRSIIAIFKTIPDASSILIDSHNNIWVDSWKSGKVLKLDENGKIIGTYQTGNNSGAATMVMDKAGNLWITASYGTLEILHANGYIKKCPQCCVRNIAANNNTAWVSEGTLLNNDAFLRHINYDCQFLPQAYKLDIQPAGLAIDNNANIWISGNRLHQGGVLEELSEAEKHTYFVSQSVGPLTIDKFGNIWVISNRDAVKEFIRKVQAKAQRRRRL